MVARLDQGLPVWSHLESCPRRTFKWRRVFSVSQGSILGPCCFWYTSTTYWTLFPPPLLDYLLMIPSCITGSHLQLMPADCRVTSMLSSCGRKCGWWSLTHPNVRFFGSHWSKSQREFLHYTRGTHDTVDTVKYLGVSLDSKLNFNDHVSDHRKGSCYLYYLKLLTLLNHDLINFGNIKIWFMISEQNFTEPEVTVYIVIRN